MEAVKRKKRIFIVVAALLVAVIIGIVECVAIKNSKNGDGSAQTESLQQASGVTSAESEAAMSETADSSDWKNAYKDYITEAFSSGVFSEFSLIYLDNNTVPELFLIGNCEATGEKICTYYNGKLTELSMPRLYGTKYEKLSGKLVTSNGNMGGFWDTYYFLEEGEFKELQSGAYITETLDEQIYEYKMDGKVIDGNEYFAIVDSWLNEETACEPYEIIYDYGEIMEKLS